MSINPAAVCLWVVAAMVGYLIGEDIKSAIIAALIMFGVSVATYVIEEVVAARRRARIFYGRKRR